MGKLIYFTIASLDGYIEDERGKFDWATPDDDVHQFINDLIRPFGTFLYGRRMYETMIAWETITDGAPVLQDFAKIWRAAEKVVFSRTLGSPSSARTRIERDFRPDQVRKALAATERDAGVGGAGLAAAALAAQLVDEYHLVIAPHVAGGGKRALPEHLSLRLELQHERPFPGGMVYLHYRVGYIEPVARSAGSSDT